ncbi:dTDP-4-dehydrorhamnose 3,5-epimerase family protein [Micromonospora okii]|uniref:3,5-epimerase n=1 Tax=Micromonospora okii TaxID=1182970 RepID=A0A023GUI1_9ACTN|nr:dTDP-4-dehydrorhamnose 3,5-epimerase [Micromonospora okii]AFJ52682.1 3,5-epimerase [Micromonospora okii]
MSTVSSAPAQTGVELPGVWNAPLTPHPDVRGHFVEVFRDSTLAEETGAGFRAVQASLSVSRRGVIRGVHYFPDGPGQVKVVSCAHGEVLDVLVDLRVGSPTFGRWSGTRLSQDEPRAVRIPRGVGHSFVALTDRAVVLYLCDEEYVPGRELTVHPFDADLDLPWPTGLATIVSDRDLAAPSLRELRERGLLPTY